MHFLLLILAHAYIVSAALFPKDSKVRIINHRQFNNVMNQNRTTAIAFVAPWCGHCQKMSPEWHRAASSLHPLVPLFAVDCDVEANKPLCAKEGIKGFPTVKLYPRGKYLPSIEYDSGSRIASEFVKWIEQKIPSKVKVFTKTDDVMKWIVASRTKPRALLLQSPIKQPTEVPLLWQVLSTKYGAKIAFGSHVDDEKGMSSGALGLEMPINTQTKEAKRGNGKNHEKKSSSSVYVFASRSTIPFRYQGHNKLVSLSKFFDSVLDGTADLTAHPSSNEDTTVEPPTAPIVPSAEPQEASSPEQTVLVEREDETDAATDSETEVQPKTNAQTHTDELTPEGRLDDEL